LVSAYPDSLQAPVEDQVAVLGPDAARGALLGVVAGLDAVVGPTVDWPHVPESFERARQLAGLLEGRPLDTDGHLVDLVLTGDALDDLRRQVLAPLEDRDRLLETLRSWLLNVGRRDAVAAELFVHPQTVRYRMGQIREAYGQRLEDPEEVLKLVVALGRPG
jgi:DNA-binding PucR family transcriptional regulator